MRKPANRNVYAPPEARVVDAPRAQPRPMPFIGVLAVSSIALDGVWGCVSLARRWGDFFAGAIGRGAFAGSLLGVLITLVLGIAIARRHGWAGWVFALPVGVSTVEEGVRMAMGGSPLSDEPLSRPIPDIAEVAIVVLLFTPSVRAWFLGQAEIA
jgi:hypothetical protein